MSKSLKTIQTISKIAKVLSMIAFVFSIIGAAFCFIGCFAMKYLVDIVISEEETIGDLIAEAGGFSTGSFVGVMIACMIVCGGEIAVSRICYNYFSYELDAGTPFTIDGANKLKKAGICAIVIPFASVLVASMINAVVNFAEGTTSNFEFEDISIGFGVFLLILSVIFRYGAEQNKKLEEAVNKPVINE